MTRSTMSESREWLCLAVVEMRWHYLARVSRQLGLPSARLLEVANPATSLSHFTVSSLLNPTRPPARGTEMTDQWRCG